MSCFYFKVITLLTTVPNGKDQTTIHLIFTSTNAVKDPVD